jgi:hypothetical protein
MQKQLQRENARFFRSPQQTTSTNLVDRSVTVACPPSIALAGIERYFDVRGNILDLTVVLDEKRSNGLVAEYQAAVEYEPQPNRLRVGRHYDRIELTWRILHVTLPSFRGRLTIRPSGTKTALVLKGTHEPSVELLHSAEQLAQHHQIAQATGRVLLRELKAILEKDFETLRTQLPADKT